MQFCQHHWSKLRQAVTDRDMDRLVANSGEQAVDDAVAQLDGTDTIHNWDPLMAAHWAIFSRVLQGMGLAALGADICPLCEVQKSYEMWDAETRPPEAFDAQGWIDSCMDSMLDYAREQGLMPGVQ